MAHRIPVRIGGALLVFLALAVLILPLQWLMAIFLAALIHECGHYLAIRFCGGQVYGFSIGIGGARLAVSGLTTVGELICALAGPVAGFLLLLFARWLPRTALCGAFHALFNLMPVYPLDGGRAVQCLNELFFSPSIAERISCWIQSIFLILAVIFGIYGTFILRLGLLPLMFTVVLLQRTFVEKFLAN